MADPVVTGLKQACIDLANSANALFDRFDEHGLEAAWEGDGVHIVMKMQRAHEAIRMFLTQQALRRLRGMGLSYEQIDQMGQRIRDAQS